MIRIVFMLLLVLFMGYRYFNPQFPDAAQYPDPIIAASSTANHRLVATRRGKFVNFHMDSCLIFATSDGHRFFESLVHPLFSALERDPEKVLLIGNPTGMELAEILRYKAVSEVQVLGFDMGVRDFFSLNSCVPERARRALEDSRVKYQFPAAGMEQREAETVFEHLRGMAEQFAGYFDAVIVNVTDPVDGETGNFYCNRFYTRVKAMLKPRGMMATQAGSTFFTPITSGVIRRTAESVFGGAAVMRANVPSIGEWGFVLAGPETDITRFTETPALRLGGLVQGAQTGGFRYLNQELMKVMLYTPRDRVPAETWVHEFGEEDLHREYVDEWSDYVKTDPLEDD